MSNKTIVLGSGISGLSAAYHLGLKNIDATVYEKDAEWGGLCGNFTIDGFRFDKAVHLSFASDEYVQELMYGETPFYRHKPEASNYYEGCWVKHPAQNNLFPLPAKTKVSIISDFIKNEGKEHSISNYEDWLRAQYGNYFAENFPMKYTRKYWTIDAKDLSTTWAGGRMSQPDMEQVLLGSYTDDIPNAYYAKEMRYPKVGGYKSFLTTMKKACTIKLNKEATAIDPSKKSITFSDGSEESYENLVSSLPIPHMITLLPNVPQDVIDASENLFASSVAIVSLGFNKPDLAKHLWYYIYDEDILPARCYSPSIKSPENAPKGCSSVQFEIYFSKEKDLALQGDDLVEHIITKGLEMEIFKKEDIIVKDARVLPYGNVVFYDGMEDDRQIVLDYLSSLNIHGVGRFGQWAYLWTDQCVLTGKNVVNENF
ncbi:MAG: Putative O-antigen synthesis protein, WbyH [uncultured Sulfurovum sp.]|uniref:O-antigen synthesis protein, WbyH n=1 Tax=uncultured Sulfurovum sp. TaxID=269237 RepID=A0A6S6TU25_9BACT|nr:MAG: Putative O-antigen synthesis protein, WbyH [uncultured Sulfurovum sp.]